MTGVRDDGDTVEVDVELSRVSDYVDSLQIPLHNAIGDRVPPSCTTHSSEYGCTVRVEGTLIVRRVDE